MFFALEAAAKNYDWGTPGAMSGFISGVRSNRPEAELWFGAHPSSQCIILTDNGEEDFPSWLNSEALNFSLLVKLLAASQPLSIQVHPDSHQARTGFEKEDRLGIDRADPQRTYQDTSPKPELIIALSDEFHALWGFVPTALVEARIPIDTDDIKWAILEARTPHHTTIFWICWIFQILIFNGFGEIWLLPLESHRNLAGEILWIC